jgi:hypothetical protein
VLKASSGNNVTATANFIPTPANERGIRYRIALKPQGPPFICLGVAEITGQNRESLGKFGNPRWIEMSAADAEFSVDLPYRYAG